jgi:hypothetical protein
MFNRVKKLINDLSEEGRERAYLNASANHYDLEMRQREIDRGLFRRRTYPY